jgi:cell division protein FtsB
MNSSTTPSASRPKRKPVLSLVIALLIVLAGLTQLLATVHTYATNVSELNSLRAQESSLRQKKEDLENDISRWNDKAYVVSQARERLGFIFPGETSVMVLNVEKANGSSGSANGDSETKDEDSSATSSGESQTLPWYEELQYSFKQADKQKNISDEKFQNGSS